MTMNKSVFEIELPFFPGFYESVLYNSDTLYYEVNDEDNMGYYRERFEDDTLEPDDLDIDFEEYKGDVSKAFVDAFFNTYGCPDFIEEMDFDTLVSPRYYNYSTDKVYANVTFADGWKDKVLAFMDENKEWLTKRIKAEWTSCDGFMSFMPNDFERWHKEFEFNPSPDERFIAAMIGYMMSLANKSVYENLIYDTLDDIYIGNYIINTKEKNNGDK